MLKPLQAVVEQWAPTFSRVHDPLRAIAAAWESIVGEDVAQNSRPQRLMERTLMVTTTSSAWSQQLAFYEPRVLEALRALPEAATVDRLRFRVGRLRAREDAAPPSARPRDLKAARDPGDGDDVLVRLRERVRENTARAGRCCQGCGIPVEQASRCAQCVLYEREQRRTLVQRMLYEAPWLGYEGTAGQIPQLERGEYDEARRDLLRRWWDVLVRADRTGRLRPDGFERRIAKFVRTAALRSAPRPYLRCDPAQSARRTP